MPPSRGHSRSLQVFNKRKSSVSDKIGGTQKLDTFVDRKLADYGYSTSIFRKVIGSELSHSSRADLYLRCGVYFASNAVRTKAPHLLDLGLPAVNASDEVNIFGAPDTRIIRPTDGFHWSAPDHFLEKIQRLG